MISSAVPASQFRQNLKEMFDYVCDARSPLIVTRKGKPNVVVLSEEEYSAWDETTYLLASPANKKALYESIAQLENGELVSHDLIEA